MLWERSKQDKATIEAEIDSVLEEMARMDPKTEEYTVVAKNLDMLLKARSYGSKKEVSPDTVAMIVANLAGIGLILSFERLNVISTKALGFVSKLRV